MAQPEMRSSVQLSQTNGSLDVNVYNEESMNNDTSLVLKPPCGLGGPPSSNTSCPLVMGIIHALCIVRKILVLRVL